MARYRFGGGVADWTLSTVTVSTVPNVAQVTGGVTVTFWSAETAGDQYTDLLDSDGAAVSAIVSADGAIVRAAGQIPPFSGPDGVTEMWASANGGPRSRMLAMETPAGAQAKADAAQAAAIAASAQRAANLADLGSAATARTNLGLGNAATRDIGTTAGTVAAGDDARIVGAAAGLAVTNLAGLQRWAAARGNALIPGRNLTITVLGDSISWGAGSDDTSGGATPEATARERAWPVLLGRRLNAGWGLPDCAGWVSFRSGFGQSGLTTSGASLSPSTGPYGGNGGGGMSVASGASATFTPPSSLGVFTELDVWYWGPDSGVSSPNSPTVIVDGATLATSAPVASGNLLRTTVTGLAATTHTVQITRAGTGNVYFFAVTARHSAGVVVNRIAISGSSTTNITGGQTGQAAQRNIDAAVMRGYSDLVIIALGTNDQGGQVPLATYQANLQATIDAAVAGGSAVLLLGEPPDSTPAAGITEDQYREVMRQLALANEHVAYTDLRSLFGTASEVSANTYGLFGALFTVHPSAKGHGFMANALAELLMLPRYL